MSDRYLQFPPDTLSVTEVIKESGLMPEYWSGFAQFYMDRGTAVHVATAYYDKGTLDESTVDPQIIGYLEAWKKYRKDTGYEPKIIEMPLFHPLYGYCGTLDRNGLDIKTGSTTAWHKMQGAAYNELEVYHELTNDRKCQTVYLQEDGTYSIRVYGARDLLEAKKDFLVFLAALKLKRKYGGKP